MQTRLLNNRYELMNPLGQGGMATVYRARDIRLGRPVAVKLLHPQYVTDAEFLRRFEHEAQAAAGLSNHPNIVDVYDVGTDNGVPYIVMELVEGRDLSNLIEQEGPLTPERTIRLAEQAADALDFAHQRGFIHRDVKPQNMLVTADDQLKITDFGIAKSNLSTAVTQAGMTFGTADYISPEQAQGLAATAQSDIYSLGIVVYEMLTKRLPFEGDTPMAVALKQIQEPPPPLTRWNPAVPAALEQIVLAALSKDPHQRPATAKAFTAQLRDYRSAHNQQTQVVPVVPLNQQATQVVPQPQYQQPRTTPIQTQPTYQEQPLPRPRTPIAENVPPPLANEPVSRGGGSGFGGLLLGILLLAGVLGLAYVAFATDTLSTFFGAGQQPTAVVLPTQPTGPTDPAATPVPQIKMAKLIGLEERVVREALEQAGLEVNMLPPENNNAPAGTIIFQDPGENATVPKGSTVTLKVSLGPLATPVPPTPVPPTPVPETPTPTLIQVPNLAGQPIDAVLTALTSVGLRANRIDEPSRTVPAGQIIRQEPAPGNYPPDTVITLHVSQGDVVVFPNVIGQDRDQAIQIINGTPNLSIDVIDEQGPDRLPNFDQLRPNQVVSAAIDGRPIQPGQLVNRTARVVLGVRKP